ncbi:MAG TPA: DegT/DnrJ/EryC1/StrS family aminotransferase, partial [Bryobacterales bacterium]|nr:DegT/DnrJ/EryC1/StrS family aminotransferase [Bryobacterales bacterium]
MMVSSLVADRAAAAPAAQVAETETPAVFGGRPLFDESLPIARPLLPPASEILEPYRKVIESGTLTNGEMVRKLEAAAAQHLDVPECVAVSSCTSGLMLVERCLGLAGRVIVPSFTFFATAHSLLWNNLEPALADCDERSWNLDPARVERAIGPGVSAILAVHLYGNPADTAELERIAARAGVRLIFDAAHAFGAARDGRPVGGAGDAEVFSLSPTKLLVAGEGGLIATRSRKLAAALRAARNYGDAGDYDCRELGLNARLSEFHAALALACLPLVPRHVERRHRLACVYEQYLGKEPGLTLQEIRPADRSTRKDFSISIDEPLFGVSRRFLE